MQTWYECKVQYLKVDQQGYERKVSDVYLLDSVSFTEAEARTHKQMQELSNGTYVVKDIKQSQISEIIPATKGEWWYKAKINLVTIDEESGKEKRMSNYVLVMGDDIEDALANLNAGLSYVLVPYVTVSIQLSSIADVFPSN